MKHLIFSIFFIGLVGCVSTPVIPAPVVAPTKSITVQPLVKVAPVYPNEMRRAGKEGWVLFELTISPKCSVVDAIVIASSPENGFNTSAKSAVEKWCYKPDALTFDNKVKALVEFNL